MDRYQDYVIKDGKFVGKFEEMYRKFDDPWHQSEEKNNQISYARNITLLNIGRWKPRSLIEFGCGLGYYTRMIDAFGVDVTGVDISETAIAKARELWPGVKFERDDIMNVRRFAGADAVLFAEITWYILPNLGKIMAELQEHFAGKLLFHNLVFYKGGQQYGRELFTTLDEFIEYMPFRLLARAEATTVEMDTIETSTVFEIVPK